MVDDIHPAVRLDDARRLQVIGRGPEPGAPDDRVDRATSSRRHTCVGYTRSLVNRARDVRKVIAAFGRHPHRNQVLGRDRSPAEEAYLKEGDFPHERTFEG